VVYEEHILQICEAFAGLPAGRADVLRRALGKQKLAVIEEIRREFMACARARGHAYDKILEVWELVSGFAGYAFCKAHSTAYGVEAYQSAWLKRYYPAEFMAAVLSNGKGFYHPLVYVLECHRLGIPMLPPFVNQPGPMFSVVPITASGRSESSARSGIFIDLVTNNLSSSVGAAYSGRTSGECHSAPMELGKNVGGTACYKHVAPNGAVSLQEAYQSSGLSAHKAIRVPLIRVKGLTERIKTRILAEHQRREFSSLSDFYRRVVPTPEEMEAMIRVGAFDPFGKTRTAQFWEAQHLYQTGAQVSYLRDQDRGRSKKNAPQNNSMNAQVEYLRSETQGWLFPSPGVDRLPNVPLQEPTRRQCLEWETELLDFAVSGHPLELHRHIAWDTYCPVAKLGEHIGEQIVTCGLIIEQRTHHQVTGEPMKFLTLADWTGMVETELFAPTYRSYGLATVRYPVLEVIATVEPFENGNGFSLRVHRAGRPRVHGASVEYKEEIRS